MRRLFPYAVLFSLFTTFTGVANGQQTTQHAPAWGINEITHSIAGMDLTGHDATADAKRDNCGRATSCGEICTLIAGVNLPQGALVTSIELDAFDLQAAFDLTCSFLHCSLQFTSCDGESVSTGLAFDGGDIMPEKVFDTPITVDNSNETFFVECSFLSSVYCYVALRTIRLTYQLQVSPAPATATFTDVPVGSFGFKHVEALAASGITAGCGGGNFCPDREITRVEMAIFLAKALGLHWPG